MKLAKKFTFTQGDNVYTAEETGTGDYGVTWDDMIAGGVTYRSSEVSQYIINGDWRVTEVLIGPETPEYEVPDVLNVIHVQSGHKYTTVRQGDGTFRLFSGETGQQIGYTFDYTEENIRDYLARGIWTEQKPVIVDTPLEVGEDEFLPPPWPFPTSAVGVEPDFYADGPDDLVTDYGISVLHIRKFCEETGWFVTVDADFYALSYDGDIHYVTATEDELAEVMQSIRILLKYVDKG